MDVEGIKNAGMIASQIELNKASANKMNKEADKIASCSHACIIPVAIAFISTSVYY